MSAKETDDGRSMHFIEQHIADDVAAGKNGGRVLTRFPPEPNGYPHIGHAKALCINFGMAAEFGGLCNLRFDDTNPLTEEVEYVEAIKEDIRWLGFDWEDRLFFASDYFGQLYEWALDLVRKGVAYVCDLSAEEVREYRGTPTRPGKNSPYRDRSRRGERGPVRAHEGRRVRGRQPHAARQDRHGAPEHEHARPDHVPHPARHPLPRRATTWCIYPTYDWAHGQSDSIEGITHSLCSLEFENHRPLYDWFLDQLGVHHPQQIEFARLNMTNTVTSKRAGASAGRGRLPERLGRPAREHAARHAAARLHAGGHTRLHRPRRRGQDGQHGGRGAAGALRARGPEQDERRA